MILGFTMKKMRIKISTIIVFLIVFLCFCREDKKLIIINDYNEAIALSRAKMTNIILIFDLFSSPTNYVDDLLNNKEFINSNSESIILRLYCDDKRLVHDSMTIGKKNALFQLKLVPDHYQPMFCIIDSTGKIIKDPIGYRQNKKEVIEYLRIKQ